MRAKKKNNKKIKKLRQGQKKLEEKALRWEELITKLKRTNS